MKPGQPKSPETFQERRLKKENIQLKFENISLKHETLRDAKTGLWNEKGAREIAKVLIESHKKAGTPLSMLMLDIDNFGALNKRLGEPEVDKILAEFAEYLRSHTRGNDYIALARTSGRGDEFVLLLDSEAKNVADRISKLGMQTKRNGEQIDINFSLGEADFNLDEPDPFQEAYETASERMHIAKDSKKTGQK